MKREELKEYFRTLYGEGFSEKKLLKEQEEDIFGDDEGDEEEEAEEGDEEEGGDEEEAGSEDSEKSEESEADEKVKIEAGDEVRLGKQFDIAIDSLLQDYEMNAIKSAQIHQSAEKELEIANEWINGSLTNLLFEQEETVSELDIDIDLFSNDVARLINNYDALMDMESIIFNKAKEFLIIKYGEDVAEAFSEALRVNFGLNFDSEIEQLEDIEAAAPLAVGAGGGASA